MTTSPSSRPFCSVTEQCRVLLWYAKTTATHFQATPQRGGLHWHKSLLYAVPDAATRWHHRDNTIHTVRLSSRSNFTPGNSMPVGANFQPLRGATSTRARNAAFCKIEYRIKNGRPWEQYRRNYSEWRAKQYEAAVELPENAISGRNKHDEPIHSVERDTYNIREGFSGKCDALWRN